jgi:Holliday junction DNA helicase RuvA
MIAKLTGKPEILSADALILDVNGVGYKVFVNKNLIQSLPPVLYIHTQIREDAFDLYGFLTSTDLQLFKLIISVSGIGPKTGLNLMEKGVEMVKQAVMKADVDFFLTVPRLGRKNAQKIIIDLKSKLGSLKDLDLTGEEGDSKEVINALIGLGFSRSEAKEALNQVSDQLTIETKIKSAIKLLGKK